MANLLESGVRFPEQGYNCPDLSRLNFLPFAPEEDIRALLNLSGYSGPIRGVDSGIFARAQSFSGVLGRGTPYPSSGTLEELSRLFWCVKTWSLNVQVELNVPVGYGIWADPLLSLVLLPGIVITTVKTCGLNTSASKTLQLRDVFANGVCNDSHPFDDPANALSRKVNAIPIDPIMKFEDLLCRGKYFSWVPPESIRTGFYTMSEFQTDVEGNSSPFMLNFGNMVVDDSDVNNPHFPPPAYGMFGLSIMNTDHLCKKASSVIPSGKLPCYTPTGFEDGELNSNFLAPQINSGTLTTPSGVITGYDFYPIVTGCPPLLAFRPNCDPLHDPATSGCKPSEFYPTDSRTYFPFINFFLRLRNGRAHGDDEFCKFAADLSTIQPHSGWKPAGTFSIIDPAIGIAGPTSERQVFSCPLFAPNATASLVVTATLSASDFWVTSSGIVNY